MTQDQLKQAAAQKAADWLCQTQSSSGVVGINAEHDQPGWPTSLAVMVWSAVAQFSDSEDYVTAIRFYQNTNVADGYACVSLDDGKQYNLRCSRRLRPRIDEVPIRVPLGAVQIAALE